MRHMSVHTSLHMSVHTCLCTCLRTRASVQHTCRCTHLCAHASLYRPGLVPTQASTKIRYACHANVPSLTIDLSILSRATGMAHLACNRHGARLHVPSTLISPGKPGKLMDWIRSMSLRARGARACVSACERASVRGVRARRAWTRVCVCGMRGTDRQDHEPARGQTCVLRRVRSARPLINTCPHGHADARR